MLSLCSAQQAGIPMLAVFFFFFFSPVWKFLRAPVKGSFFPPRGGSPGGLALERLLITEDAGGGIE